MRNLSFKIVPSFELLESMSVNLWRASCSLSRDLQGVSFSTFSMSAN